MIKLSRSPSPSIGFSSTFLKWINDRVSLLYIREFSLYVFFVRFALVFNALYYCIILTLFAKSVIFLRLFS